MFDIVGLTNRNFLTRAIVPTAVRLKDAAAKVSPEVALVGGIALGVVAAYKLAKAYKKSDEVLAEPAQDILDAREMVDEVNEGGETTFTAYESATVLGKAYGAYAGHWLRLYGPAIFYGAASIMLLTGSHKLLRGRNQALLASVKALEVAFREYRKRVIEAEGQDADDRYLHGVRQQDLVEVVLDEDGKKKKLKTSENRIGTEPGVLYSRVFDQTNPNWERDRSLNLFKLQSIEKWFNEFLSIRKVVILNEVYDALTIPRSAEGAVVGWVAPGIGHGDGYLSFGLDKPINQGPQNEFLLDFNVDGVVFEYIS